MLETVSKSYYMFLCLNGYLVKPQVRDYRFKLRLAMSVILWCLNMSAAVTTTTTTYDRKDLGFEFS